MLYHNIPLLLTSFRMQNLHKIKAILESVVRPDNAVAATGDALEFVKSDVFTYANGYRFGATRVVLVTANPSSNGIPYTKDAADALERLGVEVVVIGFGSYVTRDELNEYMSVGNAIMLYNHDLSQAHIVLQVMTYYLCRDVSIFVTTPASSTVTPTPRWLPHKPCSVPAIDYVLLLDVSASLGADNFAHVISFAEQFALRLPLYSGRAK